MVLLLLSIVTLLLGPLLYRLLRNDDKNLVFLDSFVLVTIGFLILTHIIPYSFANGGYTALLLMLFGALVPLLFHNRLMKPTSFGLLLLASGGLALHAFLDGMALIEFSHQSSISLALAVVLHRLSVGISIWWILRPAFGQPIAFAALGVIVVFTFVGYFSSEEIFQAITAEMFANFQALMAGSLFHIMYRHAPLKNSTPVELRQRYHKYSLGGVVAALLSMLVYSLTEVHHQDEPQRGFIEAFMGNYLNYAPGVMLGLLLLFFIRSRLSQLLSPGENRESSPLLLALNRFGSYFPDYGLILLVILYDHYGAAAAIGCYLALVLSYWLPSLLAGYQNRIREDLQLIELKGSEERLKGAYHYLLSRALPELLPTLIAGIALVSTLDLLPLAEGFIAENQPLFWPLALLLALTLPLRYPGNLIPGIWFFKSGLGVGISLLYLILSSIVAARGSSLKIATEERGKLLLITTVIVVIFFGVGLDQLLLYLNQQGWVLTHRPVPGSIETLLTGGASLLFFLIFYRLGLREFLAKIFQ